ncbi:MAG TPA: AraC family transcriptional regulator [Rhizobiaceae bacterium]|nr:AraC family transcriptional regulator [Rhizobiaceae bacterium]
MDPVVKALWFIEGNFARDITLDDVASAAGVSRFHLTRAFGEAMAMPVMRYLRARRLSEAARSLANGAPDILSVALDAGYGSHEAFTRAFRDQFGITPDESRGGQDIEEVKLVEAKLMQQKEKPTLEAPRIVDKKEMLIVGIGQRYEYGPMMDGIPAQWQRFQPHMGNIPQATGDGADYGIVTNSDGAGFDYICGEEVSDFSGATGELTRLRIPAQRYAVFARKDHISNLRNVMHAIMSDWLPNSPHKMADAPLLERYGPEFDGISGNGGWEIWVPIAR